MMAALQSFNDDLIVKVDFPAHICIYGKTMSGKTHLATEIIEQIDTIFNKKTNSYILVVLSPYEHIESSIQERIGSYWTIIHFQVEIFSQNVLDNMLSYLLQHELLGKEVITLLDDLIIQASTSSSVFLFLIKAFAVLRHKNISLIATVQHDSQTVMAILQNCTFIYIMQSFGSFSMIAKVLRTFLGIIGVPTLLRKIYPLLENTHEGSYIIINLSYQANINRQFTISNSILQQVGLTKEYLQIISLQEK